MKVLLILCFFSAALAQSDCSTFTDCVSCTGAHKEQQNILPKEKGCVWSTSTSSCAEVSKDWFKNNGMYMWDDTCPVTSPPVDDFLANWMRELMRLKDFRSKSFLDLSLAGTHDSLTYDLSLEVSDGGIDNHDTFAKILHDHEHAIPNAAADYLRQQAQTQDLTVTEQLDNGVPYIQSNVGQTR